jgi:uncharacterized protein YecE (DUF72 family)
MGSRSARRGELRIGTSGYEYRHWRGDFYPRKLPHRQWFEHYAERFDSVEINNTFYRLPAPEVFDGWRERAPPGFCFALKYSRYATHMKRLRDPEEALARFLEAAERLRGRLGPILVQLPPHWRADPERLDAFLRAAPRRHRFAVEMRDESWLCDEVYDVLRRRRAALVIHDLIERHPALLTADFSYLRFHGSGFSGSYSPQQLAAWARRIRRWLRQGRDVYAYFNNDRGGHAPRNAADLRRYVVGARRPHPRTAAGRGARAGTMAASRPRRSRPCPRTPTPSSPSTRCARSSARRCPPWRRRSSIGSAPPRSASSRTRPSPCWPPPAPTGFPTCLPRATAPASCTSSRTARCCCPSARATA